MQQFTSAFSALFYRLDYVLAARSGWLFFFFFCLGQYGASWHSSHWEKLGPQWLDWRVQAASFSNIDRGELCRSWLASQWPTGGCGELKRPHNRERLYRLVRLQHLTGRCSCLNQSSSHQRQRVSPSYWRSVQLYSTTQPSGQAKGELFDR